MNCYSIDTRQYRHRITIEHLTGAVGVDGVVDEADDSNWSEFHKCRAKVQSRSSREFYRAQQVHADLTHLIEILSSKKSRLITAKMRVKLDSRKLNIVSATDVDEMKRVVELVCVEPK